MKTTGIAVLIVLLRWTTVWGDDRPAVFEDVTAKLGLAKHLEFWTYGIAAAWGDADGDGRVDLYVGAFAERPPYLTRFRTCCS